MIHSTGSLDWLTRLTHSSLVEIERYIASASPDRQGRLLSVSSPLPPFHPTNITPSPEASKARQKTQQGKTRQGKTPQGPPPPLSRRAYRLDHTRLLPDSSSSSALSPSSIAAISHHGLQYAPQPRCPSTVSFLFPSLNAPSASSIINRAHNSFAEPEREDQPPRQQQPVPPPKPPMQGLRHASTYSDRPAPLQGNYQPHQSQQSHPSQQYGSSLHSPNNHMTPQGGGGPGQRTSPRPSPGPAPYQPPQNQHQSLQPGPSPRLPPSPNGNPDARNALIPLFRTVDRDGELFVAASRCCC